MPVRAVVVVVVVLQIAIPAWALATKEDRPARFGWHMFGSFEPIPRIVLIEADSERRRFTSSGYRNLLPQPRAEIDYFGALPDVLCRRHPEAASVELRVRRRVEATRCR